MTFDGHKKKAYGIGHSLYSISIVKSTLNNLENVIFK